MLVRDDDLAGLRALAGLSIDDAARIFGRSARTWRRWERDGAPPWVAPLLRLWGGDLGERWPAFRGWYVVERRLETGHRTQVLVTDHDRRFEAGPGTLLGLCYLVDALRHLEARIARLEGRHPDCAQCLLHYPPSSRSRGWIGLDDLDELGALAAEWLLERLGSRAAA